MKNHPGDPKELFKLVNEFSERKIANTADVMSILENTLVEKSDEFYDLIFSAKYVIGLKNVISGRNVSGDKYIEKIYTEFNSNFMKASEMIRNISGRAGETVKNDFENKYFKLSHQSLANTMSLLEDLTLFKEYFNSLK